MDKQHTDQQKFTALQDFFQELVESIKKDLKQDHLKQDLAFLKRYFTEKNSNRLTSQELAQGYFKALQDPENNQEALEEFIANRWLLKHSDLYYFFEQKLSEINPNFSEIDQIEDAKAEKLLQEAIQSFGSVNTYLFSILNSVVFSDAILSSLRDKALQEKSSLKEEEQSKEEAQSVESMRRSYEEKINRLSDRYEKKILGLQKKYLLDTETLKKQLASLQRKLAL